MAYVGDCGCARASARTRMCGRSNAVSAPSARGVPKDVLLGQSRIERQVCTLPLHSAVVRGTVLLCTRSVARVYTEGSTVGSA